MTLQQANSLIERADNLFNRAAKAWERGNNSGDADYLVRCERQCDACRNRAEKLLAPLGIDVSYPGLYPCFEVDGRFFHTTESAVSAALEKGKQ